VWYHRWSRGLPQFVLFECTVHWEGWSNWCKSYPVDACLLQRLLFRSCVVNMERITRRYTEGRQNYALSFPKQLDKNTAHPMTFSFSIIVISAQWEGRETLSILNPYPIGMLLYAVLPNEKTRYFQPRDENMVWTNEQHKGGIGISITWSRRGKFSTQRQQSNRTGAIPKSGLDRFVHKFCYAPIRGIWRSLTVL
jgi:hypothetical protein